MVLILKIIIYHNIHYSYIGKHHFSYVASSATGIKSDQVKEQYGFSIYRLKFELNYFQSFLLFSKYQCL